jgi:hypothetical protein
MKPGPTELDQLRARLDRVGLLAWPSGYDGRSSRVERPTEAALARARAEAGKGRALAEIVVEDRR